MIRNLVLSLPRIALGAIFLLAGFLKGVDPLEFIRQIGSYGIVAGQGAVALGYLLIPVEILLGIALVIGWRARLAAFGACTLLIIFMGATGYAWSQGKTEGCGCFGSLVARTPAQVLLEDLGFLALGILAFVWAGRPERGAAWKPAVMIPGMVAAILLPLTAYRLPLDPILTDLKPGRAAERLPLRESPVPLETGDHLVALLDLDSSEARATVEALNRLRTEEGAPGVIAFYGGEVDEKVVFCFNYGPSFELVAVPRIELKRLYRTLPRFFRLKEGRVTQVWDGTPPTIEDLR